MPTSPLTDSSKQQIAGDLMPAKTDEEWAENLVATTFLAIGPKNVNEQNRVQFDADLVDEQIDATSRVFLGMSVACARCHDHKFDAIPQTDYYAMAGIFANATTYFGNPPSEYGNFRSLQARRQSSLLVLPIDDPNPFDKRYTSSELADLKEQTEQAIQAATEARRNRNDPNAGAKRVRAANQLAGLSSKLAVVDQDGNRAAIAWASKTMKHRETPDCWFEGRSIRQHSWFLAGSHRSCAAHPRISAQGPAAGLLWPDGSAAMTMR